MKYHIVISRYNEDIQWVNYIDAQLFDIYIYNKGDILQDIPNCHIINLANTGRESHTYLYHIITHYASLPERVVFTQAHPFDHVRQSFLAEINSFYNCDTYFYYFSKNILSIQYYNNNFIEYGVLNNQEWKNYHDINSPIKKTMKTLFPEFKDENMKILFGTGAIFGVNKAAILQNSLDFYKNCMNVLNNSSNLVNPDEGHSFERLWHYIFTHGEVI